MPKRSRTAIDRQALTILKALNVIADALGRLVATAKSTKRASTVEPPKRKLKLSAKRRADLKLQGVYMTRMRLLKPKQKAQVKAVREKKGMRAAIAVAERFSAMNR